MDCRWVSYHQRLVLTSPTGIFSGRCKMDSEKEKEREAVLKKLALLAEMRKRHEWTVFGQKEAEDEEEAEAHIDLEASDSTVEKPEGE
jgi:hypothetical protein